jgi:hypothetical protein
LKHGEDVVPSKILPGEGVGCRELNAWFTLRPNVGGDLRRVTFAYQVERRRAEGKERMKSLTKRTFKGHRVLSGYATLYWRGGSLVEGN